MAVLQGGQTLSFDVVYPALGCGVRSELAVALGAKTNDVGCLEVDAHQQTTVDGVYAAGDVVSDLHQIAVATGHAAIAATHIHKSLPENYKGSLTTWIMPPPERPGCGRNLQKPALCGVGMHADRFFNHG